MHIVRCCKGVLLTTGPKRKLKCFKRFNVSSVVLLNVHTRWGGVGGAEKRSTILCYLKADVFHSTLSAWFSSSNGP